MAELPRFQRPRTVDAAIAALNARPNTRLLGGGATLVAMLNARLIEAEAIVSLAEVDEIRGIGFAADGSVRIGAFTRHRDTAAEARLIGTLAVLPAAASQIANATVRNMGTIGGSIAFADPGLDYPPALVACDAEIEIAAPSGRRRVRAQDFFVGWYETALRAGEMVVAVHLPKARDGVGIYHKHARVVGDYATVSVAISMARSSQGLATRAVIGACGPTPLVLDEANALLCGEPDAAAIERAGVLLQQAADPVDDVRGTAEYRRMLIPRMLAHAFAEARARCSEARARA